MAAEALESGLSDVKARGYLNQVRRRALEILIMTFQHQEQH
jgi:hypothetical protein